MSTNNTGFGDTIALRRQAERIAQNKAAQIPKNLTPEEARKLIHELHVHQIELEIQNNELCKTQLELEASRDRYINLFDFLPVGYCTLNEKGMIVEVNLTAAKMLGIARSALIQNTLTRFILREDQDINYHNRLHLFKTGNPQECNLRMVKKDGTIFWAHLETSVSQDADGSTISRVVLSDITELKFLEDERELKAILVQMFDTPGNFPERMAALTASLQSWSGCEAVGIRLRAGADYPYYETRGFPPAFVHEENHLCAFDRDGELLRDRAGNPVLECMCGNILSGRFDPDKPFFTAHGSFWSNNTSTLIATTTETDRQARTRNRCNSEGYESVALIPLRSNHQVFGLLQLNDHRPGRFTPGLIAHLERMADNLAIALSRMQAAEALQKMHDELEVQVQERTRALTLVNVQLSKEIKERHEVEVQLRKSKEMLQTIFDGISDPLVLLGRDMRVRNLNKSASVYFCLTEPWKAIGEFCYKVFKGESNLCKGCKISIAFLKAEDMEFERQGFMDEFREERVFLYPLNLKNGKPSEIIYRISDITERKVFEKRLIQNEKMASLGVLVSSIAHEINNPNAFISFNIPILKEYIEQMIEIIDKYSKMNPELELFNMSYPEFRKDIFRLIFNIEHGSERIGGFVTNLKEFSRIKYRGKETRIDLTSVVEKAVSICRAKVKKMVKSLIVDIPEDFKQINTDPIALEQILINLLINAAQSADKEDSWIRLSAAMGNNWLDHTIIEVKDNGCGIDEKNIDHIHDPFFSTKTQDEGTGLGLFVCHNLIASLGGRIEVETKVGEFSTFRVLIPDLDRRREQRK
ncbi:MAG: hypothetical protein C0403_15525 [Desulfobacterium sp.]|nr:hypothetical protein [Desulfobacterium sp.]